MQELMKARAKDMLGSNVVAIQSMSMRGSVIGVSDSGILLACTIVLELDSLGQLHIASISYATFDILNANCSTAGCKWQVLCSGRFVRVPYSPRPERHCKVSTYHVPVKCTSSAQAYRAEGEEQMGRR